MPARFVYNGLASMDAGPVRVKICGLKSVADMQAVARAGASYAGLVFFPRSPRHLTIKEARHLALEAPVGLAKVALVVNATDEELDTILGQVPIDIVQLHGKETPQRVAEIRERFGLPVMKAVGVATEEDLPALAEYSEVADMVLVDAKAPKDAALPGGNGLAFDWRLISGRKWSCPWMLAGGLRPDNVAEAVRLTGARQVDVSSGVESQPGVKDVELISDFVKAALQA